MLKLIVFDCDGVMFDSREANRIYYNDLLAAFNYPPMTDEELSFVHMHNVSDSISHIFRHYRNQDINQIHQFREQLDYSTYLQHMTMEADLIEFLEYTETRYKLAISTNRTNTMRPLLKTYNLAGYFQKVVTAADVKNPKPAPDALNNILSFFGFSAAETIYIGDSVIDRRHTEAVGVPLIAFKNNTLSAEYHVENFMEIIKLEPFLS